MSPSADPRPTTGVGDASASLYQEIILQHYRAPHHKGTVSLPTGTAEHQNPLCGDVMRVEVRVAGDRIEAAGFSARACSIAQATASMVLERITGGTVAAAAALLRDVEQLIGAPDRDADGVADRLGDLRALQSVHRFPARKACVRLVTATVAEALSLPRQP